MCLLVDLASHCYSTAVTSESRVAGLILARSGSSLKDKNIREILGHPLFTWPAAACLESGLTDTIFVSSDSPSYLEIASQYGLLGIDRPDYLASDTSSGCEAIAHGLQAIERSLGEVDYLIVMHGNAPCMTSKELQAAMVLMESDRHISAVIPASVDLDHHPFRAKRLTDDGFVEGFFGKSLSASSNRQDLPTSVFFLHTFWLLRRDSVISQTGEAPWLCHGNRVKPLLVDGSPGDVHNEADIANVTKWLFENKVKQPRRLDN